MKSLAPATTNRLEIKINMLSSLRILRRCHGSAALTTSASYYYNQTTSCFKKTMTNSGENQNQSTPSSSSKSPITYNPKVNKFQQVLHSESIDGWDKCWEQGLTPWDLGQPTPVLLHLHNTGSLPKGTALIPGCGTGYDVVAIASAERHVTGLDVSDSCIRKAKELFRGTPNADHFTFLKADFFTWSPAQLFDLIFDYTFFCAIEPELRPLWARRIRDLLKPEGELITLVYPIDDHEGGPPFKVSVSDYEDVLHPAGFIATYIGDNDLAVAPRMGREKLGRWKRSVATQSSL